MLLLVLNFIPGTVYAEVVGAFSIDEEAASQQFGGKWTGVLELYD